MPFSEIRRGYTNLTPFDIAAQRTSALLAAGARRKNNRHMGAFTRLDDNARSGPSALLPVHKSALNDLSSPQSPGGPSSSHSPVSPSDSSQYTSTLLPSDVGYLFQHAWAPATLHRRRNTSEMGDPSGEHNAVPPPSYQASTLLRNAGSIESGSFVFAEGGSSLKCRCIMCDLSILLSRIPLLLLLLLFLFFGRWCRISCK